MNKEKEGKLVKRLLAMLAALLMSIFNNVNYLPQEISTFNHGAYYTIDPGMPPDYRDIYDDTPVAGSNKSCVAATFRLKGYYINYNSELSPKIGGYWLENDVGKEYTEIENLNDFQFETSSWIICPYNGVLDNSSITSDGKSMKVDFTLNGDSYCILIDNMERWWCCSSKIEPDNADGTWTHDCGELKGTQFKAGQVLGKAVEGSTDVRFYKNKTSCTAGEFYAN